MTADTATPAPTRPLSVKEALTQVLGDMAALSPQALRAELDKHQDGPLAAALREASAFVATFAPPAPFAVPAGFQLMPLEPTDDMLDRLSAGLSEHFGLDASNAEFRRMYRALLAIAPSPDLAATAACPSSTGESATLPAGPDGVPAPGTGWQHTNGNRYTVLAVANGDSTRPDEYPVTVVYRGADGKLWSRPLSRWHASMHPAAGQSPAVASATPDPDTVSRIACEWLVTMWEAVARLEDPQADMAARRQAAQALRARLEQDPRVLETAVPASQRGATHEP